jgi:hypothetical protein
MTTDNITLTPISAFTANAAALVILNRIDTQIRRLDNGWTFGYYNLKLTVSDIKATYAAAYQNIEFLSFLGVIETPDYEQLRNTLTKARRGALERRDIFTSNKAHDKIRNDLAKAYHPCDI